MRDVTTAARSWPQLRQANPRDMAPALTEGASHRHYTATPDVRLSVGSSAVKSATFWREPENPEEITLGRV